MTRNKGITIHLVNLTSFMSFFAKWLALSCYRHCTVHTSKSSQITVLNGGGFGLAPLGYWLCLSWCRLSIGCAWLGANWAWLLICFCLAMAAWAWLWLCLAINGYGLAPLGYWLCLVWCRLGLVINPLGLGYGRLATGCAWLGAAWAWLLIRLGLAMAAWLLAVLGLAPLGLGY
jgi:hypothetical protein